MKAEGLLSDPNIRLVLIPAPDELPTSPEYQRDLRDFVQSVRAAGFLVSARNFVNDAVGGVGGLDGEITPLASELLLEPLVLWPQSWRAH